MSRSVAETDTSTAVGGLTSPPLFPRGLSSETAHKGKSPETPPLKVSHAQSLQFVDSAAYLDTKHPLLVAIGPGGVKGALQELNDELIANGYPALLSDKRPHQIVGRREVNPGSFGLYEYGSSPKILLQPGRYPGLPFDNWIGCSWHKTYDLSTNFPPLGPGGSPDPGSKLSQLGFTMVQVSQNQAAVCLDPQMRVFVVTDGGFVALAMAGAYRVLALVDRTHLAEAVLDHYTKAILGHTQSVRLPNGYTAATFLDIPANNVAILQRGDELFELPAGQHYLTTPSVTVRSLFTKSEVQQELECSSWTRDQVPVWLRMYLRYELQKPLELARHGYRTPFEALQDKTRSIITQIVAHLDYSTMARTRSAAPETIDIDGTIVPGDIAADFVTAVRTQATDDLKVIAAEYGILVQDLAIIDRKFKGEIAAKLDSLTTRALEAQVESANLDRENANGRLKQLGIARVQELQNSMKREMAKTEAENTLTAARARADAAIIAAEAEAKATRLRAEALAEGTRIQALADAEVQDGFARKQAENRVEVERTRAYGTNTVFAPTETLNSQGLLVGLVNGKK